MSNLERIVVLLEDVSCRDKKDYKYKHIDLMLLSKDGQISAIHEMLQIARNSKEYPDTAFFNCTKSTDGRHVNYVIAMKNSRVDNAAWKSQ